MHDYTPEAAQTIESRSRQFSNRLMVDWSNDGRYNHPLSDMSQYVVRTSRDQAISSTAPDELMLIEGYGSASLEIEVSGRFRGMPLTAQFAPYNGRSVFYSEGLSLGMSMYYEIAVWTDQGWEWYRQFTGVVREVEPDRGRDTVRIDCLDNVEKLRTDTSVHAYGVPLDLLQDGYKRGALQDSSAIIDLAARTGGFTMGPEPGLGNEEHNRQRLLSVPFHGSILPERGQLDEAQGFHYTEAWEQRDHQKKWAEAYIPGPHGYLALNGVPNDRLDEAKKRFWITEETPVGLGLTGTHTFGCWLRWDGPDTIPENCYLIEFYAQKNIFRMVVLADGTICGQLYRINNDGSYSWYNTDFMEIPDTGWNYAEVAFEHWPGQGVQGRVRINENRGDPREIYSGDLLFNNYPLAGITVVNHWLPISDLEYARSRWASDINNTSKGSLEPMDTADLSWGRNRVMYTLRETARPAWDIAKDVAAAEYGVVWFDEHGRFRFWNFDRVTQQQDKVQRYFDLSQVEGLSMRTTMDSVRNKWIVTTKTGYSQSGLFYDLDKDGEPWGTLDNSGHLTDESELWKVRFNPIGGNKYSFYYIKAGSNLMCPHPWSVPTVGENAAWDQRYPTHAKKVYQGGNYVGGNHDTDQKWVRRDLVRIGIRNARAGKIGFWLLGKDQGRFRMKATMVYEDPESTWSVSTTDVGNAVGEPNATYAQSIDRYGERTIDLGGNFWLQDEFQTRRMLRSIIKKFGRPIPVTDNITVPGDPRVQIGDVIEINDWEGMGADIRLQIYGITRDLEDGAGLTDTYQVEVVETPGIGIWDDENYGYWDQSFIWS